MEGFQEYVFFFEYHLIFTDTKHIMKFNLPGVTSPNSHVHISGFVAAFSAGQSEVHTKA